MNAAFDCLPIPDGNAAWTGKTCGISHLGVPDAAGWEVALESVVCSSLEPLDKEDV